MAEENQELVGQASIQKDITEGKNLLVKKPNIVCIAAGQGGYNAMRAMLDKPCVSVENCYYLNYKTDLLSASKLLAPENCIDINKNSYGAGKNREKAKADAIQALGVWTQELADKINQNKALDKILMFVSGGGGFGSGAGPLIAATISQESFLKRVGRRIPVEIILFKPALSANREEWFNYSEALKEYNALVNAKTISLYIADLSSSDKDDPDERNLAVDNEVAELLYRFECLNYISNVSNLDFEDRYVLSTTPKMRAILRVDPATGHYSSPFVLPKGVLVNRLGYEISETLETENKIGEISKSLGITILDKSFKGVYPNGAASSGAYPFAIFSGFNIPEYLLAEANDVVSDLNRKAEAALAADQQKTKESFSELAKNKQAISDSNAAVNNKSLDDIMSLING